MPSSELNKNVNPKVGFKLGIQADMDTMLAAGSSANAVHGTFYLTQDTHRLYVGNEDHSISAVNQGVRFVATAANLPTLSDQAAARAAAGQFYYITGSNILCVAAGNVATGLQWVQINPDSRISDYSVGTVQIVDAGSDNKLSHLRTDVNVANATGVQVNTSIEQEVRGGPSTSTEPFSGNFIIASGSSNIHINKVTGEYGNYIAISSDAGDVYRLATKTVSETSGTSTVSGVQVTLYSSTNDSYNQANAGADQNSGKFTIFGDTSNTIVPTVQNGKVVLTGGGVGDLDWDIQSDANVSGKFNIVLKDSKANTSGRLSMQPVIKLGDNADEYTFAYSESPDNNVKLTNTLPVYTKDEIDDMFDDKLNRLEGMHFAGTVGTNGTYASLAALVNSTSNLASGATVKIVDDNLTIPSGMIIDGLASGDSLENGDMIIITGTETNGTMTSNIKYTYIPSGNDMDEYFTPNMGTDAASATFTSHESSAIVHTLQFAAGRGSSATGANATASTTPPVISYTNGTRTKTIYIDHAVIAAPTVTNTTGSIGTSTDSSTFSAITGLTLENGHIKGYTVNTVTVNGKQIESITETVAALTGLTSGSGVSIEEAIVLTGESAVKSNKIKLSSESLAIATSGANNDTATIDLVWGTF